MYIVFLTVYEYSGKIKEAFKLVNFQLFEVDLYLK